MKKLLMMFCFAGILSSAYAQPDKMYKYEKLTKIALGMDISTLESDDPDYSGVPGGQIGLEFSILNFSKNMGLGAAVIYSMQGGKFKSYEYIPGGNYSNSATTVRLNYLNLPVLVHYEKDRHGFFAEAGLQPGILLSAKRKGSTTSDIKENLKKLDVSFIAGVGYKFKNKVGAGLRVAPGLMNINKNADQAKTRNSVVGISISYSL
jgi:hypothetical protein